MPGLTAERYPEVIKRIAEQGHEIGHHGYAHERFAGKTTEEQIEIIEKTQKIFKDLIGHEVTGFRTPSGDWAKILQNYYMREVSDILVLCEAMTAHIVQSLMEKRQIL